MIILNNHTENTHKIDLELSAYKSSTKKYKGYLLLLKTVYNILKEFFAWLTGYLTLVRIPAFSY